MSRSHNYKLSWLKSDIEQKFGFRGGRFTSVNSKLTFVLGLLLTVAFYGVIAILPDSPFKSMFVGRGVIPYPTVFFGFWAFAILLIKITKLRVQKRALKIRILPENHSNFILSPNTVDLVLQRIRQTVDYPEQFVLFHRITGTLSNLKNLGRVSDVGDILRNNAEQDENIMETSYTLVNGFLWAIPVLGFIGTVLGLSEAIGNFGAVLASSSDIAQISNSLKGVTGGLSTAFETTLLALVIAICLHLLATMLKKSEEEFLDACTEYCNINIVRHLRMSDLQRDVD